MLLCKVIIILCLGYIFSIAFVESELDKDLYENNVSNHQHIHIYIFWFA